MGIFKQLFQSGRDKKNSNTQKQKKGEQDGLSEEFHENGQLKMRGNFKDGKLNGLSEYFDNEDGNLTSTETWRNGVLEGVNANP